MRQILLVVLCTALCSVDDVVEVKLWGEARLDFLRSFLPFERKRCPEPTPCAAAS